MILFVYGSLKQRYGLHATLEDVEFLGPSLSPTGWKLIDLGRFPGLVRGDGRVAGELYNVEDENTIRTIDWIEGHPHLYKRENAWDDVWTYVYQGEPWQNAWVSPAIRTGMTEEGESWYEWRP